MIHIIYSAIRLLLFPQAAFYSVFIKPRPLLVPGSVPSLWRLLAHFMFLLQAYFLVF
jgi:hypothetical protein